MSFSIKNKGFTLFNAGDAIMEAADEGKILSSVSVVMLNDLFNERFHVSGSELYVFLVEGLKKEHCVRDWSLDLQY